MNNINTTTRMPEKFGVGWNIALWILQVLTSVAFLSAGFIKLSGNPLMVEEFGKIGLGQWFRYLTGAIEVASAVMLIVPQLIPIGALLLICTMFGAIVVHLFFIGGSPVMPSILLLFNLIIFLARSDRIIVLKPERI